MAWNCSQNLQQQQQQKIFNKFCCFLPPRHPQHVFRQFWLPASSPSPSQLNLFPMTFFLKLENSIALRCGFLALLVCLLLCVGMRMPRCVWRRKDSFLELTFSCRLVGPGVELCRRACLQGLYLLNHLGTLLFPLLWGILLLFFLHVLQKAWFGPE